MQRSHINTSSYLDIFLIYASVDFLLRSFNSFMFVQCNHMLHDIVIIDIIKHTFPVRISFVRLEFLSEFFGDLIGGLIGGVGI